MREFLKQALRNWNNQQPAWKPVLRFEQLSPAQQSTVEEMAAQLAKENQA